MCVCVEGGDYLLQAGLKYYLVIMKTASLRLLEVPVVRVKQGGMPPRTPPLLVTSRARHSLFLVFFKNSFLANERDNIFGGLTLRYLQEPHQTNGGLSSTCMHVRA